MIYNFLSYAILVVLLISNSIGAQNQTSDVSTILPEGTLPFTISINEASFSLPTGIQAYTFGTYQGKWLLVAGRTSGLHGFDTSTDNFPPLRQNDVVYVVDPQAQVVYSRSLHDSASGLTQNQIDDLSVTSSQFCQSGKTLYITGGYGVITETGLFSTKDVLSAIDIPGLMNWVINPAGAGFATHYIRQTSHPAVRITGGYMEAVNPHLSTFLLVGQDFEGYYTSGTTGIYSRQVRCLQIIDNGEKLYVQTRKSQDPDPNYRRRDLNVIPRINGLQQGYVILSGVFTLDNGVWTVPIFVNTDGTSFMPDPSKPATFKQGMNNYVCPSIGLYSWNSQEMFVVLPGGLSYEFFSGGVVQADIEIPFINQVTTIKIDSDNSCTQYIMDNEFPVIISTGPNPGNRLIFGTNAQFLPTNIAKYSNGVLQLDTIKGPTVIGYIVGGIMSTLIHTSSQADSTASPYIFEVVLTPR